MNVSTLDDNLRRQAERALRSGDFVAVSHLREQFLPDRSHTAGAEDSDILAARGQHVLTLYGFAGYPADEVQLRHVLHGQRQFLGPDHPSILFTAPTQGGDAKIRMFSTVTFPITSMCSDPRTYERTARHRGAATAHAGVGDSRLVLGPAHSIPAMAHTPGAVPRADEGSTAAIRLLHELL